MPKKKAPQRAPIAVRLTEEMDRRFTECSAKTKMSKHALAIQAIEAAVEAIERNGFRLVVPIEFEVVRIPSGKAEAPAAGAVKVAAAATGRSSRPAKKRTVIYGEHLEAPSPRVTTDSPADLHGAQ